ncbi:PepSY domain-containing protein [Sphingomonas sp.]|jgi:hypothetical protein|uniref:PepSY domain-containing protein n=1 Tax=Sphingomonas sp. TaxID=28214 RepID=UPI002D809AA1|nr:PepSY domain-containing protein [Sphingomonas sp.]HEU0044125.1 PepSY domain-containing protein [Sphingomonas sp.]
MRSRHILQRLHVWLAWVAGVPLLFWTLSGLWMVARPIDEVRGTGLRAPLAPLVAPAALRTPPGSLKALALERQGDRLVWIAVRPDGASFRADPVSGRGLAPVAEPEARLLAAAALAKPTAIERVTRSTAEQPPLDLRRARPAWGVMFAGGDRVYLDADTGQVLALRTEQWRAFDWMWGLHIMDLSSRENSSHPVLIGFAALALLATILGLVLLPLSSRRRR